ncbi:MAG TPA: YihY/virulence factor BrkB family protein [Rhodocyclaceae bacterium]|nr:YihY/virulence factor BrkB family protein [Rhodocyclaceae bacterium]
MDIQSHELLYRMRARYQRAMTTLPVRVALACIEGWRSDRCMSMAAALAFYAAFSLAPILVIVIAVAGFFFGEQAVEGRLFAEIRSLLGTEGATAVQAMVASAWKADRSGWTAVVSVVAVFLGASATFAQLSDSLNTIWRAPEPSQSALFSLVKVRLVSFGLVIGIAFLIVILLVFDAGLSFAISEFLGPTSGMSETIQQFAQWAQRGIMVLLLGGAFAALLKVLPATLVRWSSVWLGAATAAILFSMGKNLFGLYLARAGTANAFGAAGSLAVLLMWLYFSSAVFLLGAELAAHWNGRLTESSPEAAAQDTN